MNEAIAMELLGSPFLEYVLNATPAEVSARFAGTLLGSTREKVLGVLLAALEEIAPNPDANEYLLAFSLGSLVEYQPASSTSYANTLRLAAGGSISVAQPAGQVELLLGELARDIFPIYLLPPPSEPGCHPFMPSFGSALFRHPKREELNNLIMEDSELSKLFPEELSGAGRSGQFLTSAGRGGGIQLAMFAETALRSAWERLRLADKPPALNEFIAAVTHTIDLIRTAVSGSAISIPVRVGLTGVKLPEGTVVDLPWGRMRSVGESDRRDIPASISGQLSHTSSDGESVVIDYGGDVVLEMEIPYRLRIGEHEIREEWPADLRDYELIQRRIESVQLGLLLTFVDEPRPFVVMSWQKTLDPLVYGSSIGWRDAHRTPNLLPKALTGAECADWGEWIERVDVNRVPSIEVAIRRMVLAATDRSDPSDALVDAVIAWENLVGSRRGEPTLRVSAALAWLLDPGTEARKQRRKTLSGLYELRSDVVHGNRFLPARVASEKSREAVQIALEALRVLFNDRTELLRECSNGDERSNRLIIEGNTEELGEPSGEGA